MSRTAPRRLVVGYDGSAASSAALTWAAVDASHRGLAVHVVTVWQPVAGLWQPTGAPRAVPDPDETLESARMLVRSVSPTLAVTTAQMPPPVARTLIEESRGADSVVVGARGETHRDRPMLGSVSWQVASHAVSPVVVVPAGTESEQDGSIVVGVDGSSASADAIGYAFQRASLLGRTLTAVHAWHPEGLEEYYAALTTEWQSHQTDDTAVALLETSLAGWAEKFPEVEVRPVVKAGHPADVLLSESRSSSLLVAGSRGRGGFAGLVLGSVTREVLERATIPVVVVRPPDQSRP